MLLIFEPTRRRRHKEEKKRFIPPFFFHFSVQKGLFSPIAGDVEFDMGSGTLY